MTFAEDGWGGYGGSNKSLRGGRPGASEEVGLIPVPVWCARVLFIEGSLFLLSLSLSFFFSLSFSLFLFLSHLLTAFTQRGGLFSAPGADGSFFLS